MKDMNDPTNRDSVPAMLTPGEFVLNKEASNMFGPAIEAMNNAGLQQRHSENLNMGGMAPPNPMGYNKGGKVDHEAFIKKITPHAKKVAAELGIDPRVIIAQAIQETGWGRKVKGNNYFGIKAHGSDDGKNVSFGTHEYDAAGKKINIKDTFKGYDDIGDSVRGYGEFLKKNPRYKDFLAGGDLNTQLSNMGNSGYATDPNYGKNLGNIINGRTFKKFYDGDTPAATATTPAQNTQQAVPQMQEAPPVPQQAAPPPQQRDEDMYYPVQEDFGGAFAAARNAHGGDGGQFTWKDKYYTTDVARNVGGPIGYNKGGRAGKKVKYWDSAQGTYVWGTKEQAAQAATQSSLPQVEPTVTKRNPMNFRMNAGVQAPPPPMQPMPGNPMQLGNVLQSAGSDPVNTAPSRAGHIGNRFNFGAQPPSPAPQVDSTPPVPGSDEALLQGGSQKVEQEEEDDNISYLKGLPHQDLQQVAANPNEYSEIAASILGNRRNESTRMQGFEPMSGQGDYVPYEQPPPTPDPRQAAMQQGAGYGSDPNAAAFAESERMRGNALLGDYAKQFEKGDPRRAAAFNQQAHQVGGTPGVPEMQLPPPPPQANAFQDPSETGGTGAVPMANAFQDPSETGGTGVGPGNQVIANLPIGDPTRMAAIESGEFIPTEGDLEHEDYQYQANEALRREQMLASVTATDAPAAQFRQNRIQALTSQLDSLGTPKGERGVGVDVKIGGSSDRFEDVRPTVPQELFNIDQVGAVPTMSGVSKSNPDLNPPLPSQVISNTPEGLFGDMTEIMPYVPGGEAEQGLQQASETDSPIVTKPGGALMNVDESGNQTPVVDSSPPAEKKSAVQTKVEELGDPLADDEAARAQTVGEAADPSMIEKAKGLISDNFGGLFDEKELKRAAVLFAGAMITGMSPQRALAYAGTNYINRIDAKEAATIKGEAAQAKAALENRPFRTGVKKTMYHNGRKIQATQIQTGKDKTYVDSSGQLVPQDAHEDASIVQGTPEYNKRVDDEGKTYADMMKGLRLDSDLIAKKDGVSAYKTGIQPDIAGRNIAKWAAKNNVPPEAMGQLVRNAYDAAINGSTDGNKAKSIEGYLNDQYVSQQVGDPELFAGAPSDEVNKLMRLISARSGLQGSIISNSTTIMQKARPIWNALPQSEKDRWVRQTEGNDITPFMAWMQADIRT